MTTLERFQHQERILAAALRDIRDNRAYFSASDRRLPAARALLMAAHYHVTDCTCAHCLPDKPPPGYGA